MDNFSRSLVSIGMVFIGAMSPLFAESGPFVAPADGPVAFRIDQVPLTEGTMRHLSKELTRLASGVDDQSAEKRRAAAQMLALALALNPINADARQNINDWKSGERHRSESEFRDVNRGRLWEVIDWLNTDETGDDAWALALCLTDVMWFVDPGSSKFKGQDKFSEHGAWANWVPGISAYEKKEVVKIDQPPIPNPIPTPDPRPTDTRPKEYKLTLNSASIITPLWDTQQNGGNQTFVLKSGRMTMTARMSTEEWAPPFTIHIGNEATEWQLTNFARSIEQTLREFHGDLPKGLDLRITSPEIERTAYSGKQQSLSAASFVLASAAITGNEPSAIVIGKIGPKQAYQLPSEFWQKLQSLGAGNNERLVLPMEATEYLESMLALGKPEFFMDHEVLLAKNAKDLLAMTAKNPTGAVAAASEKFKVIQETGKGKELRRYIGNAFVKQRLAQVLADDPNHISAKMLLAQATGNRTSWFSRNVLVAEILRVMQPVADLPKIEEWQWTERSYRLPNLGDMSDQCREQLTALERNAVRDDRELINKAREVLVGIRGLDRALNMRGESYVVATAVAQASSDLSRSSKQLIIDLEQTVANKDKE